MKISYIGDTKIAVVDNVFSHEKVGDLYELATWAQKNGFKLTDVEGEDFALTEEGMGVQTPEDHYNEWERRNYTVDLYPSYYKRICMELSAKVTEIFDDYLDEVGIGRDKPYREIQLDVIHIIKAPDTITEHIDCFDYGLVFYLGASEDYSGGDLYFTELDITMPMVPNRLVIIPAHLRHRVNIVESGMRISMTTFIPFD
jgi:hypothetical protein